LLLLYLCFTAALRQRQQARQQIQALYFCFTNALLLLYLCFTAALRQRQQAQQQIQALPCFFYCITTALPLLYLCFTTALLLLYYYFTSALLLHRKQQVAQQQIQVLLVCEAISYWCMRP
jgi:hypothetical protein